MQEESKRYMKAQVQRWFEVQYEKLSATPTAYEQHGYCTGRFSGDGDPPVTAVRQRSRVCEFLLSLKPISLCNWTYLDQGQWMFLVNKQKSGVLQSLFGHVIE
ncbi:hypothetical protein ACJX0J_033669, partial [Zea mays]